MPLARFNKKEGVTLDDLTLSNAWELEALVEVLTAKGVMMKREVLDRSFAAGTLPATPYSDLVADPNKTDIPRKAYLGAFQFNRPDGPSKRRMFLTHLQMLVEMGERVAHGKTTHRRSWKHDTAFAYRYAAP